MKHRRRDLIDRNPVTVFSNAREAEMPWTPQLYGMVERNALPKTPAGGEPSAVTLASHAGAAIPLSIGAALEIAGRVIVRLGLSATHKVHALYAGVDRQTEGAAFAVIVRPLPKLRAIRTSSAIRRFKLLIHEDGNTTIRMAGDLQPA